MAVLPQERDDMVAWFNQRIEQWEAAGAAIGVDPALLESFKSQLEATNAATAEMFIKRNAAISATEAVNSAAAALRARGAAIIATIKAHANTTGDPDVFEAALVPPPRPHTATPPPAHPRALSATPNATGTITLTIKGSVARNGSFDIERSVDGGPYTFVKNMRAKTWTDEAVPMNAAAIAYRVFGVRQDRRSIDAATARVQFGTGAVAMQAAFRSEGRGEARAA